MYGCLVDPCCCSSVWAAVLSASVGLSSLMHTEWHALCAAGVMPGVVQEWLPGHGVQSADTAPHGPILVHGAVHHSSVRGWLGRHVEPDGPGQLCAAGRAVTATCVNMWFISVVLYLQDWFYVRTCKSGSMWMHALAKQAALVTKGQRPCYCCISHAPTVTLAGSCYDRCCVAIQQPQCHC